MWSDFWSFKAKFFVSGKSDDGLEGKRDCNKDTTQVEYPIQVLYLMHVFSFFFICLCFLFTTPPPPASAGAPLSIWPPDSSQSRDFVLFGYSSAAPIPYRLCVVVWFKEKEENWPNWLLNKENWTEAVYLCGTLLLFLWANSFRSLVLLMLHLRFLFSRIPGIIQAVCSFNYIKQCWVLCREFFIPESFVLASPESCFPIHF